MARRRLLAPAGILAGLALDVGASMMGDTPDTRDSTETIARYFTEHRTSVFAGSFVMSGAFMALAAISFALAEQIEDGGRRLLAQLVRAASVVTVTVYLVTILLPYVTLSYVVGTEAPGSAKAMFELTLVASLVIGWPLGALVATVGVGLARSGRCGAWFVAVSGILATLLAASTASFAHHGYFSPDVQQQVVLSVTATWLLTAGFSIRPSGARVRRRRPAAQQRHSRPASATAWRMGR